MEKRQENFILSEFNNKSTCQIRDKYTDRIYEISTSMVRNILNQKYISGPDMKAVLCLFDTLFLTDVKNKNEVGGLRNLTPSAQKWITKMKKLNIESAEGIVYITDILSNDIQVIIKVPQEVSGLAGLLREYYIGITCINKMRYLMPTMMYTLGAFLCPKLNSKKKICSGKGKKTAFVIYEKIKGESLADLLENKRIKFNTWLILFAQLLLTLETAQREIRFTHFDLHPGNVMVKEDDDLSYTIPLDNTTYHVNKPGHIPIIIDFGLSCVYDDGKYIGSYDFPNFGMINFMVPGYDMYKFIIFSADHATGKMRKQISQVLEFYGDDELYQILEKGDKNLKKAVDEYVKKGTYDKPATYTPQQMVDWLLSSKKYSKILNPYIKATDRVQYLPIQYSSSIQGYNDIFNNTDVGGDKAIKIAKQCIGATPSYVMTKYNIQVLEQYNIRLKSHELDSRIKGIKLAMNSFPDMSRVDKIMLNKVFDIKHPPASKLKKISLDILDVPFRGNLSLKKRLISEFHNVLEYQVQMSPYLQFYYTILELKLDDEFSEWLEKLRVSSLFKFYLSNVKRNERVLRWSQTLQASIKK